MKLTSMLGWIGLCLAAGLTACGSDDDDDDASSSGGAAGSSGGAAGSAAQSGSSGNGGSGADGSGGSSGSGSSGSGGSSTGGSSGSGGDSTGGSSGSGGSATGGTGGGSGSCCATSTVAWGPDGGFVAYVDQSTLSPCDTFNRVRNPRLTDPPSLSCTQDLGGCDAQIRASDVQATVDHPDVQAAVAKAPVLFGCDTRPVDGQVLQIRIDGALIEVGNPGCDEIPEGVATLAQLLRVLDTEQRGRGDCASVFPLED